MKKLFLSLIVAFSAHTAMANVQLELKHASLNPVEGDQTKYIRVHTNGTVLITYCDSLTGACLPATHVATLSHYAMNHIYRETEFARGGNLIENKPLCTAVPSESKSYSASNGTVALEYGTYPCGVFTVNATNSADYLISVLNQYE